jgi:hypothetical protein
VLEVWGNSGWVLEQVSARQEYVSHPGQMSLLVLLLLLVVLKLVLAWLVVLVVLLLILGRGGEKVGVGVAGGDMAGEGGRGESEGVDGAREWSTG